MRVLLLALPLTLLTFSSGCTPDPKSGAGFTLPEGQSERGQSTFVRLQCHACHTVAGAEMPALEQVEDPIVALGGETTVVKTYGNLVTSIINPSHRFAKGYDQVEIQEDGQSKMPVYNDRLTVQELCDLVAFLQDHYELKTYQPTPYVPYY